MPAVAATRTTPAGVSADAEPDSSRPAVAWGPIIAGAFAAAGISLILVALGLGLGFAAASPWPSEGASITTFSIATAIWLIIIHWLASGFGGYLTGRLRLKWVGLHTHEVFFRDTAHGFLAWALATVVATAAFASLSAAVIGGGARLASSSPAGDTGYFVDLFYRTNGAAGVAAPDPQLRAETGRILVTSLRNGEVSTADRDYLAQLVAGHTGLSQADARRRVDDVINQAKTAADKARKAGAALSLFTALAMVIGAFIAATAGALGGWHRDEWSAYLAGLPASAE